MNRSSQLNDQIVQRKIFSLLKENSNPKNSSDIYNVIFAELGIKPIRTPIRTNGSFRFLRLESSYRNLNALEKTLVEKTMSRHQWLSSIKMNSDYYFHE